MPTPATGEILLHVDLSAEAVEGGRAVTKLHGFWLKKAF